MKHMAVSIEDNFQKLEEKLNILEAREVSLEEAFLAYSEGIKLLKECEEQIEKVEKEVLVLNQNGELEALDSEE